jgi:hypothetical protein
MQYNYSFNGYKLAIGLKENKLYEAHAFAVVFLGSVPHHPAITVFRLPLS